MDKRMLKAELSALSEKVVELQKLLVEDSVTIRKLRKVSKEEATHWRVSIINEVRRNDQISREDLIRSLLPYSKKGKGKYLKMYWFIGNMVRNGELFVKNRGLTVHLLKY
jgi:hypothetical protein